MYNPLVSIIIPTYNEEKDIESCLSHVLDLSYDNKEIIVVDDASTDGTLEILKSYAKRGLITLLRHRENTGVAAARNTGIREASGEIVFLLNADVLLTKDFISKVLEHYRRGADFVVCQSRILNTERVIPAYLQAQDEYFYGDREDLVWSEGFSCRRWALLDVGCFDERFPGASGEDVALAFRLDKKYKRVYDRSIVVPHIAPENLRDFINQRIGRGRGEAFFDRYSLRRDLPMPFLSNLIRLVGPLTLLLSSFLIYSVSIVAGLTLLSALILWFLFRPFRYAHRLSRVGHGKHLIEFLILGLIEAYCKKIGYLKGCIKCLRTHTMHP